MPGAYGEVLDLVLAYLPHAKHLGTVYVPAEVNTVFHRDQMVKAATERGMEMRVMAANSPTEVADAAMALATSGVDAITQITGNLTASAFPAIRYAAHQARVPVFSFQSTLVHEGALAGVVRDYYDGGREAAGLAVRVLRGESPASIPLVEFKKTVLMVNLETARELGITTPPAILASARDVVGK
jgi:putative ABC transport system substrate-binding protein